MRAQQHEADHLARDPLIQQVADGEEIPQALGHLLALDLDHLVVHPDLGEAALAAGAAALGDLVLVVGELQVDAAAMDVEALAQELAAHRRALDVPAGAAAAPGAVPAGGGVVRGLPEHEIHRVALVGCDLDPGAGDHVLDRAARERAIGVVAVDREQHMALGGIGAAPVDQRLDHRDHLGDVLGGTRLLAGQERAERAHVLVVPGNRLVGDLADVTAGLGGACVDLVVDVGDVADIGHVVRPVDVPHQPVERVEHHHRPRIAQMGAVIDGGAADIHPHVFRVERLEPLLAAGRGVGQLDLGHRSVRHEGMAARGAARIEFLRKKTCAPRTGVSG